MLPTKSSRKRQARLAFTPVPSSSPLAKGYNKQIQDRAAAVTLEESPVKRRKIRQTISNDEHDEPSVPIPDTLTEAQRTTNVANDDNDEEDALPRSTHRRVSRPQRELRARQRRLDFSNARDADSFDPPVQLPSSSARTRTSTKTGMFSSQVQGHLDSSDDSEASQNLPSPSKLLANSKTGKIPEKRAVRRSRMAATEEEEESDNVVVQNSRSGHAEIKPEDEDDDDDIPMSTQARRRRRAAKSSSPPIAVESESEDDDGMPTTAGVQRRGRRKKRRMSLSSFIEDSPPPAIESDSDDLQINSNPSNKRRSRRRHVSTDTEMSEDEAAVETPNETRKARGLSERERRELADDMDALASSSADENSQRVPRTTQSVQKNARQKALDRLKSIRSSQPVQTNEQENEAERESQEDNELYDDDDDDDDDDTAQYTSSRQVFRETEEDADFIEEDNDGVDTLLGVPADLPLEFTRFASMKAKELFKHAVEWMVMKVINPGFKSDDPLYQLAFRKLDDEVRGLAGSKFTSSAWTPEFTIALQARPEIVVEEIDRGSAEHFLRDKCDACNRSGHPATFEIQFQGKPYNRDTLEEVPHEGEDGHGSDSESDSSNTGDQAVNKRELPDWDDQGREVRPEMTSWYVGRFCKVNAETASNLQHWRWHLYQRVDLYLTTAGYRKAEEVMRRDRWNTNKRQKYANKIVDRMDDEGEIKKLWHMYRDAASEARNSKQGRYAGR